VAVSGVMSMRPPQAERPPQPLCGEGVAIGLQRHNGRSGHRWS
jgi:hypothetical protein